MYVVLLINFRL